MTTATATTRTDHSWQRRIGWAVTRPPVAVARTLRWMRHALTEAAVSGQLGRDYEQTIGRNTGARI